MKLSYCYRIKVVFVVFVAAIVIGGGSAKADFTFGEPTNLGPNFNGMSGEGPDCISSDGLEMYFDSNRSGGYGSFDIWVAKRETIEDDWGTPINLGPKINGPTADVCASISFDGLELYFSCPNRVSGYGAADIWVSTRQTKEDDWETPVNLGSMINSPSYEAAPWISADGLELYFDSNRSGGFGNLDIWVSRRATKNDPWGEPTNLGSVVNRSDGAGYSSLSSDGLLLLFSDDLVYGPFRPDGFGNADMWMSRRSTISDPWSEPVNLGLQVNGSYGESQSRISPDGQTLYFSSTRPGGYGGTWGDIWQAPIIPIVDFNGDGNIDTDDLLLMIDNWGTDNTLYDIGPYAWGDGVVNEADLEVLMSYWGQEIEDKAFLAHWKMDEAEGNIAYDSIGEYHSTLNGDPIWQPEGGIIDGTLQFDGIDDYVNTPFILNPYSGPFSIFAWVKGGSPDQVIISQTGGADWLLIEMDGLLMTELKAAGTSGRTLVAQALITDGNWHRIGFVWNGGMNRILYVDDVEVARDTQGNLASSSNGLYIGAGKGLESGSFFSGLIDDVRIYNQAITP